MSTIFGPGGVVLLIKRRGGLRGLPHVQPTEREGRRMSEGNGRGGIALEVRFQQMRSDIKEAFGFVGELTKQVTLLAERSRTNTRTRAD
jgi:hypothetical protein